MARAFDVVGYDPDTGEAITAGEVMGEVMGAAAHRGHRMMRLPAKPNWRNQLAPGVIQPDEGMVPLPLNPSNGTGIFDSTTVSGITFSGQLQKPYRPERLLVSSVRSGSSSTGRLLTVLYVGTDLQQAEINGWDAELVGQPGSFGTRLTCKAAEPGVLIRAVVNLSNALSASDTIFASFMFLGRVIH